MTRTKILFSTILAISLLATQVIAAGAAPATQETTFITGTVESITLETDANTGNTTVVVVLTDEMGATQSVRLNLEDATVLGLVVEDGTGSPVPDDSVLGTAFEIDPSVVIPEEPEVEEKLHPVGSAISDFFFELLGVDYEMVMGFHDDGAGFGVIAQALWMTNALEGDSETFAAIMEAKQNKDYSGIVLPDGSTPKNWGQFRQAVLKDREKAKENLGAIMSGHADGQPDDAQLEPNNNGNSQNNGNGNGNNEDKGKDKDKEKGKDKNKNKDK